MHKRPRIVRLTWAAVAIATSLTCPATASTSYVDDDAGSGGDGATWETAYRFLQDALIAAPSEGTDEIRIAGGTYAPDRNELNPDGTGDRQATFGLITGVDLIGGYAGLAAGKGEDPDARDLVLFETVLTGDLAGNDEPEFVNIEENAYTVVTAVANPRLDGLTIAAGNADGAADDETTRGAGIYLTGGGDGREPAPVGLRLHREHGCLGGWRRGVLRRRESTPARLPIRAKLGIGRQRRCDRHPRRHADGRGERLHRQHLRRPRWGDQRLSEHAHDHRQQLRCESRLR